MKGNAVINGETLNNWTGLDGFGGTIPSYSTELKAGSKPLFEDGKNVLAAYRQVGQGIVMQTSFSVGDDPLAKTENMTAIWQ